MNADFCYSFVVLVFITLFNEFVNGKYVLGPSNMTWADAKAWCENRNDILYMQSEIGEWGDLNGEITFQSDKFWIGLSWSVATNDFRWQDNSPVVSDEYWMPGQPDNTTDYHCVYGRSFDGMWATATCDTLNSFVCQDGSQVSVQMSTPRPRPQGKRDNNAVMLEGLLKGFACAGGLILLVAVIMHLPCCRNWVNKKENEVFKRQRELQKTPIEPVATFDQAY